jgi:hypothetical protein
MKTIHFILWTFLICPTIVVHSQSAVLPNTSEKKVVKLTLPENSTQYSIVNYKNIDFLKTNPLQLEKAGLHPEVYVSNTNHGVIIICTEESNEALKNLSKSLEINPNYYEKLTRQDTLVLSAGSKKSPTLDFTKASSINQEYKNAFNYKVDPRTGVSWSKISRQQDRLKEDMFGKIVYDLIFVIANPQIKR